MLFPRYLGIFFALTVSLSNATAQVPSSVGGTALELTDTQSPGPIAAQWRQLSDESLRVSVEGEVRDIPVGNLRQLKLLETQPIPKAPYAITLRDGSTLSAAALTSDGRTSTVTLASGQQLAVPTKFLGDVRLRELTEPQQIQWQAMRDSRLTADLLALIRSEDSLDKIEGLIIDIAGETVNFEFSGQAVPAPFAKLAGIRFFASGPIASGAAAAGAKLAAVVRDTSGNVWQTAQLSSLAGSDSLKLVLRGGLSLSLPLSQLAEIDFSVGSMKYLAELEPLERVANSRFDLAIPIPGSQQVFGARAITVKSFQFGPSLEFLGSGSVTYRIPADFTRLVGSVALNPPGNKATPCRVEVLLENKVVWQQRLSETKQFQQLDLPVAGDQRVQLVVRAESNIPVGDVVVFRELRFLK